MTLTWQSIAIVLALFVAGCQRESIPKGVPPLFGGSTLFHDDNLSVTLTPGCHRVRTHDPEFEKSYEPVIENVAVIVDGTEADVKARISRSFGMPGWCQSASFSVPATSQSVKVVLRAKYREASFRITVPFERDTTHGAKWNAPYSGWVFDRLD